MANVNNWITIFQRSIADYHVKDNVDTEIVNPYPKDSLEQLMYVKNWVDTVQWHLEDIIRNPQIDPLEALAIKRRIDSSNQHRTDLVEFIDSWFLNQYNSVKLEPTATYNTESPAWAIDRLSILELKIFHMQIEADRKDASDEHRKNCTDKLNVLLTQRVDLSTAIQQLLDDIAAGKKFMKVYKQMKMYNDESLNPVLYQKK
ncbi:MAG TPA: DUF4254 domain-containing protein [Ferruginibacter sp.]|nr:DUF4254 domain-containing protein [Ferruginibacter sp.]HRE64368.1 DUF4254 domain-containing protein [Ferruginibacter sp.]